MRLSFKTIAMATAWLVGCNALYADLLAGWDVDGVHVANGAGIDQTSFPYMKGAGTLGANIASAELTLGFDAPSDLNHSYGFKFSSETHKTSLADAIANDHFIQFTVVAVTGYRFGLSSIEMKGQSGTSGPDDIALMSDVDGFESGKEIVALANRQDLTGGWDTTGASGWGAPIDLSASQYRDLDSVTFRIYGWNSTGTASAGIRNLSGNDLVVNGTVNMIPEPAAIGLISLAGLGALIARRFGR